MPEKKLQYIYLNTTNFVKTKKKYNTRNAFKMTAYTQVCCS